MGSTYFRVTYTADIVLVVEDSPSRASGTCSVLLQESSLIVSGADQQGDASPPRLLGQRERRGQGDSVKGSFGCPPDVAASEHRPLEKPIRHTGQEDDITLESRP